MRDKYYGLRVVLCKFMLLMWYGMVDVLMRVNSSKVDVVEG